MSNTYKRTMSNTYKRKVNIIKWYQFNSKNIVSYDLSYDLKCTKDNLSKKSLIGTKINHRKNNTNILYHTPIYRYLISDKEYIKSILMIETPFLPFHSFHENKNALALTINFHNTNVAKLSECFSTLDYYAKNSFFKDAIQNHFYPIMNNIIFKTIQVPMKNDVLQIKAISHYYRTYKNKKYQTFKKYDTVPLDMFRIIYKKGKEVKYHLRPYFWYDSENKAGGTKLVAHYMEIRYANTNLEYEFEECNLNVLNHKKQLDKIVI